jgi:predicted  nucleic acid-binding Zn-ribbon protein
MGKQEHDLRSRIQVLEQEIAEQGTLVETERDRAVRVEAELEVLEGKLSAKVLHTRARAHTHTDKHAHNWSWLGTKVPQPPPAATCGNVPCTCAVCM